MKEKMITMPELGLIAGTRVALGAGLGLLLADHFDKQQRHAAGWTLLAIGALATIPLAAEVMLRPGMKHDEHDNHQISGPGEEEPISAM